MFIVWTREHMEPFLVSKFKHAIFRFNPAIAGSYNFNSPSYGLRCKQSFAPIVNFKIQTRHPLSIFDRSSLSSFVVAWDLARSRTKTVLRCYEIQWPCYRGIYGERMFGGTHTISDTGYHEKDRRRGEWNSHLFSPPPPPPPAPSLRRRGERILSTQTIDKSHSVFRCLSSYQWQKTARAMQVVSLQNFEHFMTSSVVNTEHWKLYAICFSQQT